MRNENAFRTLLLLSKEPYKQSQLLKNINVSRSSYVQKTLARLIDLGFITGNIRGKYEFNIDGFIRNFVDYYISRNSEITNNLIKNDPNIKNYIKHDIFIEIRYLYQTTIKKRLSLKEQEKIINFLFSYYSDNCSEQNRNIEGLFYFMKDIVSINFNDLTDVNNKNQ